MISIESILYYISANPSATVALVGLVSSPFIANFASKYLSDRITRKGIVWFRLSRPAITMKIDDIKYNIDSVDIYIRNLSGHKCDDLAIILDRKPQNFNFDKATEYTEKSNPDGKHVISISRILPDEEIILRIDEMEIREILSFLVLPSVLRISYSGGECKRVKAAVCADMPPGKYSKIINLMKNSSLVICAFLTIFLVVRSL